VAPPLANACGWVAGGIGIVTGWPQAWRLWAGRRHEGLSLTSNVLAVLYCTAWLLYGVSDGSNVQVLTNLAGFVGLSAILAGHVVLARPAVRRWLPLLLVGWAVLGGVFLVGTRPLGLVASAATISGVLPQAVVLARRRRSPLLDASGVSRPRWSMSCACNLLWVAYGLQVGDPVIIGNSGVIAVLALAIVLLARPRTTAADPISADEHTAWAVAA
jgi:uncharacterized protein with PQ loop repeat